MRSQEDLFTRTMLIDLAGRVGSAALCSTWQFLSAVGATAPALSESALCELEATGFTVIPRWLPEDEVAAVLQDALALESISNQAGVGSDRRQRRDDAVRRAAKVPLHPPPASLSGHIGVRLALSSCMHGMCKVLNDARARELATLRALSPFDTELGYLYYPQGGHYERHLDVPAPTSPSRAATALREVSVLLYLDAGWQPEWGGQLRIYPDCDLAIAPVEVLPDAGTLVLLRSARIEHEVRPTHHPRHAVIGWLRAKSSATTPATAGRSRRTAPPKMASSSSGAVRAQLVGAALREAGDSIALVASELPRGFSHGALGLINAADAISATGADVFAAAEDFYFVACQFNEPETIGLQFEAVGDQLAAGDARGAAAALQGAAAELNAYSDGDGGASATVDESVGERLREASRRLEEAAEALEASSC